MGTKFDFSTKTSMPEIMPQFFLVKVLEYLLSTVASIVFLNWICKIYMKRREGPSDIQNMI